MRSTDRFYRTIRAVVVREVDPEGIETPLPVADNGPGYWWQFQDDEENWKNFTRLQCYRINRAYLKQLSDFKLICSYENNQNYIASKTYKISFSQMTQKNVHTNRPARPIRCIGFTPILQHGDEFGMDSSPHRLRSQQLTWWDLCKHADQQIGWGASE